MMKRIACLVVTLVLILIPFSAFAYEELSAGSKGDDVKALQERLIELEYLTGTADGVYGKQTKAAVELFQAVNDTQYILDGIADEDVQELLFSKTARSAMKATEQVYNEIDFDGMMRNPDAYCWDPTNRETAKKGHYKFTGKVIQVVSEEEDMTSTRVATNGRNDDVAYVKFYSKRAGMRILEGDKFTIYGRFTGMETFQTVLGANATLPVFYADNIILN